MASPIVGLSGSVTRPSRTTALVRQIAAVIAAQSRLPSHLLELVEEAPHLFGALTRARLSGRSAEIVAMVEQADLLIVGTPVYRASYTGALKHLFDLVDHRAFIGKPVVLAATGGSQLHGLVTEHQLRPLFGFLNALTLPTTVYATEQDFEGYEIANPKTLARIDRICTEAVEQLERRRSALEGRPKIAATG
jgi:FMN reductase